MKGLKILWVVFSFLLLTILTQVGGLALLAGLGISTTIRKKWPWQSFLICLGIYFILTLIVVPVVAPFWGREAIRHNDRIYPAHFSTVLLNRNYVTPDLNQFLTETSQDPVLSKHNIHLVYLDANFPFVKGFPLLPHLSHDDGKKIDLGFVYQTPDNQFTNRQRSRSGYGVFVDPLPGEPNQPKACQKQGFNQYSLTQYLTFGKVNPHLEFSMPGTRYLLQAILKQPGLEKIFLEPHLKERLQLPDSRIRFHGCHAVRHDDHLHLQIR